MHIQFRDPYRNTNIEMNKKDECWIQSYNLILDSTVVTKISNEPTKKLKRDGVEVKCVRNPINNTKTSFNK